MAVTDPLDLLAEAASPGRASMRVMTGRWDGRRFHPSETPHVELEADNAAGNLTAGSFVYALHDGKRVTIIGPTAPQPAATVGSGVALQQAVAHLHQQFPAHDPEPAKHCSTSRPTN